MNKKTNTILFILGATLFNIIVVILSFIILLLLFVRFIAPSLPESGQSLGFTFIFVGSIVISVLVYRAVLKTIIAKIDVEKYFDPIFTRKHVPKK